MPHSRPHTKGCTGKKVFTQLDDGVPTSTQLERSPSTTPKTISCSPSRRPGVIMAELLTAGRTEGLTRKPKVPVPSPALLLRGDVTSNTPG